MRILYLSTSYVPYGRADSIQVMKMCQAMVQNGHQLLLITKSNRRLQEKVDDFQFYGVEPIFTIKKLPRPGIRGGGLLYSAGMVYQLWRYGRHFDLIYTRDLWGGWIAAKLKYPVVFEAHGLPPANVVSQTRYQYMITAESFLRLVVISEGLLHDLEKQGFLSLSGDVVIAHDGANPLVFPENTPFPKDSYSHIGYVGHLYPGKGMEIITQLANRCPEYIFDVVGGETQDLAYWQSQALPENIKLHGFVHPSDLARCYQMFDVLILPAQERVLGASRSQDISRWMSPMKMFEYMATGKPILASNLPVLREVLTHERNALLVPPNDIDAWEEGLGRILSDRAMANQLGQNAKQDLLEQYTWQARARKVLQGL